MTSSFPFPARATGHADRSDAVPVAASFTPPANEHAAIASERERRPDFADLCEPAAAPATPPIGEQTAEVASAEPPPANPVEPATESTVDVESAPASVDDEAMVAANASVMSATSSGPTLGTMPQMSPLTGQTAPTSTLEPFCAAATLAEYGSCLALRTPRPVDAVPKPATATTPASTPATSTVATAMPTVPAQAVAQAPVAVPAALTGPANVPVQGAGGPTPPVAVTTPAANSVPVTATPGENATTPTSVDLPTAAQVAATIARGPSVRTIPEKVSGRPTMEEGPGLSTGQKNSLDTGQQPVAGAPGGVGTGTALHGDTMKSGPQFAPPPVPLASDAGVRAAGHEGGADPEFSYAWKGWTNGGGERASTAAQFSRLTEHALVTVATHANPASTAGRAAAAALATPPAPAYPTNEAALLAPIGAAIERLVTRGQDQLSVVVRFEQGGSLSLQLTLRDGGIVAHMQTDVPGLEAALRSSWASFAQDWNHRGVKLAAPSFGAGVNAGVADGRDHQRSPQHEGHELSSESSTFAPLPGRRPWRSAARADVESSGVTAATKLSRARLAQRGLSTWA
jgi:hypothetical protein